MPGVHPSSVTELRSVVDSGRPVDYLCFSGHQAEPDGMAGPGCLSQWWPSEFETEGQRFATSEHYMMWRKAVLFADVAAADRILGATDPEQAKAYGREVTGFDSGLWSEHRYAAVVAGNLAKFDQHPELARFLLGTGDQVLVETSPVDRIWGIGFAADDDRATDPRSWPGLNLLGFALMDVRAHLRATRSASGEALTET